MSDKDFYKKWFATTVNAENMHLFEKKHGKEAVPKRFQLNRCCCGAYFEEEHTDFRCLTCNTAICDDGDCGWYCGSGRCDREERWCKDCIPKYCPYLKITQELAQGKAIWEIDFDFCSKCYKSWKKRKLNNSL